MQFIFLNPQELMEEDDVLQECKSQNKKLVEFLTKKETMEDLMNFIVKEPIDDEDEKVRYKWGILKRVGGFGWSNSWGGVDNECHGILLVVTVNKLETWNIGALW